MAQAVVKLRVHARDLRRGDVVGSGETVCSVSRGVRTPPGKHEITLEKCGQRRLAFWGSATLINVFREKAIDA
jgi:hypothetical protein